MSIPGFAAEISLSRARGYYVGGVTGSALSNGVYPATCCSDCPTCDDCSPGDCPPHNPGCCAAYLKACLPQRRQCLKTCTNCPPPPCCPKGCQGTCP